MCSDGRCWGFHSVLMEDELLQRAPGSNAIGQSAWSYTDTGYRRTALERLGPVVQDVYVGEGELGADTDRFHMHTEFVLGTGHVAWPSVLRTTEWRDHPTTGARTARTGRVEHTYDAYGNVETVRFDPASELGTPQPGPESVRQETRWVGDADGVLFVPYEQWLYDESAVLVEHARYAYDHGLVEEAPSHGLLTSQELASGASGALDSEWISWSFTHDSRGQVSSASLPNGLVTSWDWSLFGGAVWHTETQTGDFGEQDGVSDSFVTTQTVDTLGRVSKVVSPNGNGSRTLFDAFGRPTEQWRFGATATGGEGTHFLVSNTEYVEARDEAGQPYPARTKTTSHNYNEVTGAWESQTVAHELLDAHGRAAISLALTEQANEYRVAGVRRGVLDQELTSWMDARPRLQVENDIPSWWDLSTVPGPALSTHLVGWGVFDGLGEVQEAWTLDAGTVHHTYPEPGQHGTAQVHHGAAGQGQECHREESKLLVSDLRGRLLRVEEGTNAALGNGDVTGSYTYDVNGRVTSFVNGVGDALTYDHDGVGRLRHVSAGQGLGAVRPWVDYTYLEPIPTPSSMDMASGTATMAWDYDALGRTIKQSVSGRDAVDEVTEWFWDAQWKGAVDTITFPSHHGGATLSYVYDQPANPAAHDLEGWRTGETLSLPDGAGGTSTYTFGYEHDPLGRITREVWPTHGGNSLAVLTDYYANGKARTKNVKGASTPLEFELVYDNYGELSEWHATDWDGDPATPEDFLGGIDRVGPNKVGSQFWSVDGSLHGVQYEYCGDDAVLRARHYDQAGAPQSFEYDYDDLNRIQEVIHSATGSVEAYSYDLANNPTAVRVGAASPTKAYSYGVPTARFAAAFAVGAETLQYDLADRVFKNAVGGVNRDILYDGQSRVARITKSNSTASMATDYWYAPGNGVVEEVTTGGPGGLTQRLNGFRVIDDVAYAQVLPWLTLRDGQPIYTLEEKDGRASMVLDANGAALSERYISAYGVELFGSGGDWPIHGLHGSQPNQDMQVAHFGARHMSLRGGGLWLQREPLLASGGLASVLGQPRSFSGAYAHGNPMVYRDPTGNHPVLIIIAKEVATEAAIQGAYAVHPVLGTVAEVASVGTSPIQLVKRGPKLAYKAVKAWRRVGARNVVSMAPDVARAAGPEAVTEAVEEVAEKAAGSATAKAAKGGDSVLYRGVDKAHPVDGAYDNALSGKAVPRGGHDIPSVHNGGDTNSVFTSWTPDKGVAKWFATKYSGKGVVLSKDVPSSKRVASPDFSNESEVLVVGTVSDVMVEAVTK